MIPTKTIINCLREYAKSSEWHLRRIMLDAAKRLETDRVELVRCKDCKYCELPYNKEYIGCFVMCARYRPMRKMECDDFCSYGERREGE